MHRVCMSLVNSTVCETHQFHIKIIICRAGQNHKHSKVSPLKTAPKKIMIKLQAGSVSALINCIKQNWIHIYTSGLNPPSELGERVGHVFQCRPSFWWWEALHGLQGLVAVVTAQVKPLAHASFHLYQAPELQSTQEWGEILISLHQTDETDIGNIIFLWTKFRGKELFETSNFYRFTGFACKTNDTNSL